MVKEWYGRRTKKSQSFSEKLINWYLRRHSDKLFACEYDSKKLDEIEPEIIPFEIDEKDAQKVASQIKNAKSPVLVVGSQATLLVDEIHKLIAAIELLQIPTFLSGMARGLLIPDHPLHFMHGRSKALKTADLVILAGVPMDFRLNYGRAINKKAFLISINRDIELTKKNRKADLGIEADPSRLIQAASNYYLHEGKFTSWIEEVQGYQEEGLKKIKKYSLKKTDYINPLVLCKEINKKLDDKSILIGDGGDFIATASYLVHPRNPLSWLDPGPFGTLGIGAGFALASKLVRPEEEVWLLWGDGASGYGLIEFDSFVRHNIPIIAVIGNDAGWSQIERDQVEYLHDNVGTDLKYNNYHQLARSLGAEGLFIQNVDDISKMLNKAKQLVKNGIPVLVNAFLGKTDFRKGSISM